MRRVCTRLTALGVELHSCHAVEFFAREGNWHTVSYASAVARLDAWEIDRRFEKALRRNLPHARVRIGDSFELAEQPEFAAQFDLVVYDNPQVTFGDGDRYCEHFEALDTLSHLMKRQAAVIFNVNRAPFDYDLFPDWQRRRSGFYKIADTRRLDGDFLITFYKEYFRTRSLEVRHMFLEPRHEPHIVYLAAVVTKAAA